MHTTLRKLLKQLENKNLTWAIGGSLMLSIRGLKTTPNDIDLLVTKKDAQTISGILDSMGTRLNPISSHPVFTSSYFAKYEVDGVGIDVMADFGVKHKAGLYVCPFATDLVTTTHVVDKSPCPLSSIEDWYVLYSLMPNREGKVELIEHYFKEHRVSQPLLLERALDQPLPLKIKEKINRLLTDF